MAPLNSTLALAAALALLAVPAWAQDEMPPDAPPPVYDSPVAPLPETAPEDAPAPSVGTPVTPWTGEAVAPLPDEEPRPPMVAVFRALDKITARIARIEVGDGETAHFGTLDVTVRACSKRPPEEPPEVTAFVEIKDERQAAGAEDETRLRSGIEGSTGPNATSAATGERTVPAAPDGFVFSGWMFASSPSLAALEHPVYDVWLIDCKPAAEPAPAP